MSPISPKNGRFVDDTISTDNRTYAVFNHLVGLGSLLDILFVGLIASIVMWQIKKDESAFLDDHGREAVNFQLSLLLYSIASFGILIPMVYILRIIGCVRGGIAANRGEYYRYPMCIRFIDTPAPKASVA